VCDCPRWRLKFMKFDLPLVQCRECGLIYANPRSSVEKIKARYSPDYFWNEYLPAVGAPNGEFDLAFFDARHAAMFRLIERRRKLPSRRMLEVGAGAGFFLKAAERAGWSAAGVEISTEGVAFATSRLGIALRQEPAEALSFASQSFDVAVMFDVIEHLLDPLAALAELRRVLQPGGLLVVWTPNVRALSRWALGQEWAVFSPAEHLHNFSSTTLAQLLHRGGFRHVTFENDYDGLGVFETMNPHYSHAPSSYRNRLYSWFVHNAGRWTYRRVQSIGAADLLLAICYSAP
jgi:SAM-dependent methyltransferase